MAYQSQRQTLLSQNISNLDHPDYQARDLKAVDFSRLVNEQTGRLKTTITSSGHLPAPGQPSGDFRDRKLRHREAFEETPVGNNISIDQQTAIAAQNSADFQITSNLFRKYAQLLRTATVGLR